MHKGLYFAGELLDIDGPVEVIIFNGHGQAVLWQGAAAQRRIYDTNYTVEASGGAHSGTAEEENCKDT